ncbi:hypothetical protein [Halostella litorea]|uniref:hypothetical protein n=1 Tax=Halostella litorea TaxID=2528831 RepID=UPI001F1886A8|nr:hypothetical protein [Halostella litorea]
MALLALLPAMAFAASVSAYAGAITAVNVVLIFGSIYLLVSPTETEHGGEDVDHAA